MTDSKAEARKYQMSLENLVVTESEEKRERERKRERR